jgi:cytochrome c
MRTSHAIAAALAAALSATLALTAFCTQAAQADPKHGEKLFDECKTCHSAERGVNGVGPSLAGVVGRKAGTLDDFRYSPAMKRSDITWNPKTLDAFLNDPQQVIPANRMPYSGMPDAKSRADLIEYMREALK